MQSPKVSIYEKANDKQGKVTTLSEVIERIRTGADGLDGTTRYLNVISQTDPATYKIEKEKLKAFTPSGTFPPYKRKAKHLLAHSAHIIIDIDRLTPGQIADLLAELAQMPYVVLAFVSPSGKGIKVLVRVDPIPRNDLEHKGAYQACLDFFEDLTEEYGFTIDTGGKDCSRLCFLAHHPHPVVNTAAPAITWDRETYLKAEKEKQERFEAEAKKPYTGNIDIKALDYIDPNDLDYTQWLSVITACKKEGLTWQQVDAWSRRGSKYTEGEVETRWDGLHLDVSWGAVVNLAKPNGYTPPHKHRKQKLYQIETPSQVSTQTLEENSKGRDAATDRFLSSDPPKNLIRIQLVKDDTGSGKTYTSIEKAKQHGKPVLALTGHNKLAEQAIKMASEIGFKNPLHLKGREHNWDASGIAEIPIAERTAALFDLNGCIMCEPVRDFIAKNLAAKTYCMLFCPFRTDAQGNIICSHLQQYIGLSERDFIVTSNLSLLFDPSMHPYLKSLVNAKTEPTDEDLAIDAMLGTTSEEKQLLALGVVDDYQLSMLYPEKAFSQDRFKSVQKAWSGTPTAKFASLMLKAFEKKKPQKIVKALRNALESTTEHHAEISKNLAQHARRGIVEHTYPPKGSKETQNLLSEKHVCYTDGGKQFIPVNMNAYLELTEKDVPVIHPSTLASDVDIGKEVIIPHAPSVALQANIPLKDLTPVWQKGVTPIDLLRMFLSQIGNPKNAPIKREFTESQKKDNAVLTFSIPPQAPVGILEHITMLSATVDPAQTRLAFAGQPVAFSDYTGPEIKYADGVETYQYQEARLTSGSVFEYPTDIEGKRQLQEGPTGLKATAKKRLAKLNDWAKQVDGLTAFISYKELTSVPFREHIDGFDIVTHFDKVTGLNFKGLKLLVIFGCPKVKHEVLIWHAHKQYAPDSEPLPKADPTLLDDNGKPIPEYIQLTEETESVENGISIIERRYKDPRLEKIRHQLSTKKLKQALGRARFIRWEDTTTLLITNTPVKGFTERATLFSDAALNLAETPGEIPAAMDRIKVAVETGDVQAIMETKAIGKSQAYEVTKEARQQEKSDRDAQIIALHQQGKNKSEIHRETDVPRKTVSDIISRYEQGGENSDHLLVYPYRPSENPPPPENTDTPCVDSETLHTPEPSVNLQASVPPPIPFTEYSRLDLNTARKELERCQERNNYNGAAFLRSHIQKRERQLQAAKKGASMDYYNILTIPASELFAKISEINDTANDNASPERDIAIDALNNLSSLLEKRSGSREESLVAPGQVLSFGTVSLPLTQPPD